MKEEISTYRSTIVSQHRKAFESRTSNFIFRTNETTVYSKGVYTSERYDVSDEIPFHNFQFRRPTHTSAINSYEHE